MAITAIDEQALAPTGGIKMTTEAAMHIETLTQEFRLALTRRSVEWGVAGGLQELDTASVNVAIMRAARDVQTAHPTVSSTPLQIPEDGPVGA